MIFILLTVRTGSFKESIRLFGITDTWIKLVHIYTFRYPGFFMVGIHRWNQRSFHKEGRFGYFVLLRYWNWDGILPGTFYFKRV